MCFLPLLSPLQLVWALDTHKHAHKVRSILNGNGGASAVVHKDGGVLSSLCHKGMWEKGRRKINTTYMGAESPLA